MKTLRLTLLFLLNIHSLYLFAQPANDNYAGAIDVTSLINSCSSDAAYTTAAATADLNKGSCWNTGAGPVANVWFRFTAPATGQVNVTVDIAGTKGTQRYTQLALWQADGTTQVACNLYVGSADDVSVGSTSLTPGATYYISVDVLNTGQRGTFTLCLSDAVDYDYYEGAIDVTSLINTCSADAVYSTAGATADKNAGSCWNNSGPLYNRWFKFTAPASGRINVTVDIAATKGTQRYTELALWQSNGTTQVACNLYVNSADDVVVASTALTPGATYYISVDVLNSGQRGTFTLCLSDAVDYDYYEGAIDVTSLINTCSADAIYSTIGATADKNPGSCWNNGGPLYNRWFKFTAPASGRINVTVDIAATQGTQRYTELALWQSDGTTQVACNLYVNSTDDVVVASTALTPGATYYISVDVLNSGQRGTFTLCLSDAVDYDYYEGAIDVTSLINSCSADAIYSTIGATADKNPGSCWNNSGPLYNRWFKFTAPASGRINVTVDIAATKGTQRYTELALWQSNGTTQVACNLYVNSTDDVVVASTALTPGATYYISVDVLNSGQRGTFTLCLSDAVDYDYYEGAIDVTSLINTCSADAIYSTIGATADKNAASCWNNGGPLYNRWFKFIAPASGRINVTVDIAATKGTQRYTELALWQSNGTTQVACNLYVNSTDDVVVASTALTPGATYYISVDVLNSGQRGTFTLCLSDAVDYDYYEGAIDVTSLINTCSADAIYSTIGATADKNAGSCWNNSGPLYNRWFKFTAPATGKISITVDIAATKGTQRYTELALWQSNGTTQVACNLYVNSADDVVVGSAALTPGATYYISVDVLNSGQRGTFSLCLNDVDYDYYDGAFELTDLNNWCSADAAYTTVGATGDKNAGSCWNNGGPLFNRWFKFQAITSNVTLVVDIAGSKGTQRYTQLALWQADGITQVACSRYVASADDVSIANGSLVVGNWYYISVDVLNSGQRGTFTLCINNVGTTFYSRASGVWNSSSTWSTAGYGGAAATSFPNAGDVANIQGYDITVPSAQQAAEIYVDVATANTSLTVNANTSLTVNGKMTLNNSGNNFTGALNFLNNSSLYVNNNLIFNRLGGDASFGATVTTGSSITVNRDLQWTSTNGTVNDNLFTVNGSASVIVNQDINLSSTGGRLVRLQFNNTSILTVLRDINFTATAAGLEAIELNNSAQLKIGRNFVRGATPYGTLTCNNTSTVEYNGAVYPQIFAPSAGAGGDSFFYRNVVINNTRTATPQITMGGAATINGNLTMTSGVVSSTAANILNLLNTSVTTIGSSQSYIEGPMTYEVATAAANTVRNFPLGKNGNHRPAILTVSHSDASSVVYTAEHFNSSAAALGYTLPVTVEKVSGVRYWQIDRPASPANLTSATIRLYYGSGTSDGVTDFANLTVVKTVGAGTDWFDINGTASGNGSGNILSGSFSTFSKFTLANKVGGTNPLPVTWKSFTGDLIPIGVNLRWITASEHNNDYFEVQRSENGEKFEALSKIHSSVAGNSVLDVAYEFLDEEPLPGNNYYRIRQVDFDNASSFSNVIRITNDQAQQKLTLNVYPNPVTDSKLNVRVKTSSRSTPVQVVIYDLTGNVVFEMTTTPDYYAQTIELDLTNKLAKGMYLVKAAMGQITVKKKLIVID